VIAKICSKHVRQDIEKPCGEYLCDACIECAEHDDGRNGPPVVCRACNETVRLEEVSAKSALGSHLLRFYNDIPVQCRHCQVVTTMGKQSIHFHDEPCPTCPDCKVQYARKDHREHETTCAVHAESCRLGCETLVRRDAVDAHEQHVCVNRLVACPDEYCQVRATGKDLATHVQQCPFIKKEQTMTERFKGFMQEQEAMWQARLREAQSILLQSATLLPTATTANDDNKGKKRRRVHFDGSSNSSSSSASSSPSPSSPLSSLSPSSPSSSFSMGNGDDEAKPEMIHISVATLNVSVPKTATIEEDGEEEVDNKEKETEVEVEVEEEEEAVGQADIEMNETSESDNDVDESGSDMESDLSACEDVQPCVDPIDKKPRRTRTKYPELPAEETEDILLIFGDLPIEEQKIKVWKQGVSFKPRGINPATNEPYVCANRLRRLAANLANSNAHKDDPLYQTAGKFPELARDYVRKEHDRPILPREAVEWTTLQKQEKYSA